MDIAPILIISGTNRPLSSALKTARVIQGHYRALDQAAEVLSLEELPPEAFDPRVYADKPPSVVVLQQRVLDASGLHVICPEYNGSFPGVLKYFIDLLKFPESFEGKPVAFVGEALSTSGALRAVEHLQQVFGYRNAYQYPQRVFIGGVDSKFTEEGAMNDAALDQRLEKQVRGFIAFIRRHHPDVKL